jgi:hypothetical protein
VLNQGGGPCDSWPRGLFVLNVPLSVLKLESKWWRQLVQTVDRSEVSQWRLPSTVHPSLLQDPQTAIIYLPQQPWLAKHRHESLHRSVSCRDHPDISSGPYSCVRAAETPSFNMLELQTENLDSSKAQHVWQFVMCSCIRCTWRIVLLHIAHVAVNNRTLLLHGSWSQLAHLKAKKLSHIAAQLNENQYTD